MKRTVPFFLILLSVSCAKNAAEEVSVINESNLPKYDTLPIDSFSNGATSVDVAQKIRVSSQIYQDSLREERVKIEKEKLLKKEADEKLKAEKLLEEKKKKETNPTENISTPNSPNQ